MAYRRLPLAVFPATLVTLATIFIAGFLRADEQFSVEGAVSDTEYLTPTIDGVTVHIWGAARNADVPNTLGGTARKQFFYLPPFEFVPQGGVTFSCRKYGKRYMFSALAAPRSVDRDHVWEYLKGTSQGRYVEKDNVLLVRAFGARVVFPGFDFSTEVPVTEKDLGVGIQLPVRLDNDEGSAICEDVNNGRLTPSVDFKIRSIRSILEKCEIYRDGVIQSSAYRDFVDRYSSNRRLFTVTQVRLMTSTFHDNAGIRCTVEGKAEISDSALWKAASQLFTTERQKVVDWERLADVNPYLVDLAADRYAADVVQRLAYDSSNLNDAQWCNKWRSKLQSLRDEGTLIDGKLSANYLWVIGGSAAGRYEKTSRAFLDELLEREDCGRKVLEQSFAFEIQGSIKQPRGIRASESLAANLTHSGVIPFESRVVLSTDRWISVSIRR